MFLSWILVNIIIINCKYVTAESEFDLFLLGNEHNDSAGVVETIDEQAYSNGTWLCGKCTDLNKTVIYSETYDVETNDDKTEVQFGVSIPNMRCVTVTTDDVRNVKHVTGSCSGDSVTLSVFNTSHYEVSVY